HSTVGAQHAAGGAPHGEDAIVRRLMAYCIAGHHAGLPDWSDGSDTGPSLWARLRKQKPEFASALRNAPRELLEKPIPPLPEVWRRRPFASEHRSGDGQSSVLHAWEEL